MKYQHRIISELNLICVTWKRSLNIVDYCVRKKKRLHIGKESKERRGERMARKSARVDTAVGGEGK